MEIYNCHTHTFTIDNVPDDFAPLKSGWLLRFWLIRKPLAAALRYLWPFSDNDLLDRYVRMIEVTYQKTQMDVFRVLIGQYPTGTKFVILPMDMEFMGAGHPKQSFVDQHTDLIKLSAQYPAQVFPFVAVDPRRPGITEMTLTYLKEHGFQGIKLYPPLGYYPFDERLEPIYAYAQAQGLPVLSHCSPGGVYYQGPITDEMLIHPLTGARLERKKNKEFAAVYADPDNYIPVLEKFPNLKLCLAHFGGGGEWAAYLHDPWYPETNHPKSWLSKIADMIKSGAYPQLYTDISYTLHERDYFPLLKVFLENEAIGEKVLFGTDYYLVTQEVTEREFAISLRAFLGEKLFKQITHDNPRRFLGL